jgi:hypothetical protein
MAANRYFDCCAGLGDRYMAASAFNLCGSGGPDNELVRRTRAALQA